MAQRQNPKEQWPHQRPRLHKRRTCQDVGAVRHSQKGYPVAAYDRYSQRRYPRPAHRQPFQDHRIHMDKERRQHKFEKHHIYKLTVYEGSESEYVTFLTPAGAKAVYSFSSRFFLFPSVFMNSEHTTILRPGFLPL
jgi:hypothetical protein